MLRFATALRSLVWMVRCRFSSMKARTRAICQAANASGLAPLARERRSISERRIPDAVTSDAVAVSRSRSSSRFDQRAIMKPIASLSKRGPDPQANRRVHCRVERPLRIAGHNHPQTNVNDSLEETERHCLYGCRAARWSSRPIFSTLI